MKTVTLKVYGRVDPGKKPVAIGFNEPPRIIRKPFASKDVKVSPKEFKVE